MLSRARDTVLARARPCGGAEDDSAMIRGGFAGAGIRLVELRVLRSRLDPSRCNSRGLKVGEVTTHPTPHLAKPQGSARRTPDRQPAQAVFPTYAAYA